jgi:hypothetical protein
MLGRSKMERRRDFFEVIVWSLAILVVGMLVAHWAGAY